MQATFEQLSQAAAQALRALAEQVDTARPLATQQFRFRTGELDPQTAPSSLFAEVEAWSKANPGRYVYVFESEATSPQQAQLHAAMRAARSEKRGERSYSRLLKPSPVFYVGSSSSLRTRVREHLGFGQRATFAMQLAHWAQVVDVTVTLSVAVYPSDTADEVLGALEDHLWTLRQPMLGRQGRR